MLFCVSAVLSLTEAKIANAPAPIRGWTSWDLSAIKHHPVYGREWLNASNVLKQSAALVALQPHGFDHINVDSFWAADPTKFVDQYGHWTHNATRFPDGMASVAAKVHARGQKFGLYVNPGVAVAAVKQQTPIEGTNCTADMIAQQPHTGGNVFGDGYVIDWGHRCAKAYVTSFARHFVLDLGIDFLKIDAVSPGSGDPVGGKIDNARDVIEWSAALEATGRPVWLAVSWAIDPKAAALFAPVANSWRVGDDVDCYCTTLVSWASISRTFPLVLPWLPYSGSGIGKGRPDLDAINVGMGALDGLTDSEKRLYVSFWALVGAPLYIGNDLTALDAFGIELLTNPHVLAINADTATTAAPTASSSGLLQTWTTDRGNGTVTVGVFNLGTQTSIFVYTPPLEWSVGVSGGASFAVTDVWTGEVLGVFHTAFKVDVDAHACRLLSIVAAKFTTKG